MRCSKQRCLRIIYWAAIKELRLKYQTEDFSFQIELLGGGFQFLTKPAYQTSISILSQATISKEALYGAIGDTFYYCLQATDY